MSIRRVNLKFNVIDSSLVSVVVPVYNAESFLTKCIENLRKQTYKNIEIILVNDGSSDKSESICLDYVNRDDRIHYVYKKNGGASTARNKGVLESRGDYIVFCDADDMYFPHAIETLLSVMQKYTADMVIGGITNVEYKEVPEIPANKIIEMGIESALEEMYYGKLIGVSASAKLYKKELLVKYPYKEGVIHEDTFASYRHLYESRNKLVVIDSPIYFVNQENESISRSAFNTRDLVYVDAMYENLLFLQEQKFLQNRKIMIAWSFMYIIPMLRIIDKMIKANYEFDYSFYRKEFFKYSKLLFLSKKVSFKHKIKCLVFLLNGTIYRKSLITFKGSD